MPTITVSQIYGSTDLNVTFGACSVTTGAVSGASEPLSITAVSGAFCSTTTGAVSTTAISLNLVSGS